MKTIAVFFGGESVEHDVSLITGTLTLNSLDKERFSPLPVYVDKKGGWYTGEALFDLDEIKNIDVKKLKRVTLVGGDNALYQVAKKRLKKIENVAVAINCMHGERGEDGCLAGLLSLCKIPLVSPDVLPSSVCMDKGFTKIFLSGLSVDTLPCVSVKSPTDLIRAEEEIGYPLIIKPTKLGSSVGVGVATNREEGLRALRYALSFGESAVVEKRLVDFIEINCAGYMRSDGEVIISECERPVGRADVLSFSDKYELGKREFPAKISTELSEKIKRITKQIYLALNATGIIRIDYFVLGERVLVNEINTVPGSLGYYLFTKTLGGFKNILTDNIALAEKNYARSTTFVKDYRSGILNGCGAKGAKRLKKK